MNIAVIGDVHWSVYSSIVRTRGRKYSTRLENLIQTINWCEKEALKNKADLIVYLGDFFDKADLSSEEITALNEVKWANLPHYFVVGNHEIGLHDNLYSTCELFNLLPNAMVMSKPSAIMLDDGTGVGFLPYTLESDREPILDALHNKCDIIFSHNDLICNYGIYKSTVGYELSEIDEACNYLFVNGHIHNHKEMGKVINVGNITGQNFSEDAFTYNHYMMFIDTSNFEYRFVENPYAMKFYKVDFSNDVCYYPFNSNSVVTIKCELSDVEKAKELVKDVLQSRIVVVRDTNSSQGTTVAELQTVDHLQRFVEFVHSEIGSDELVNEELKRVIA